MAWYNDLLNGDESVLGLIDKGVTDLTGSEAAGMGASAVVGIGSYFIPFVGPYLGAALSADDVYKTGKKLYKNPHPNEFQDYAELGAHVVGTLPMLKGLKYLDTIGSPAAKYVGNLKTQAAIMGGLMAMPQSQRQKDEAAKQEEAYYRRHPEERKNRKFNHYGKMMTAAEIKADNTRRAKIKALEKANAAKLAALKKTYQQRAQQQRAVVQQTQQVQPVQQIQQEQIQQTQPVQQELASWIPIYTPEVQESTSWVPEYQQ